MAAESSTVKGAESFVDGKPKPKRRFTQADWRNLADYIIDTHRTRKTERKVLELHWDEIDRQIKMEPDVRFKRLPNGKIDTKKMWMSEVEPPLQAQALEVLVADARRLGFPDVGTWFRANAEMTDDYLEEMNFKGLILGDKAEVPSQIDQDNTNKLVQGFLLHLFRQYDLAERMDRINAEAFKYGMGIGRGRLETKDVYLHTSKGVMRQTQTIPTLIPASVRMHYLDDALPSVHSSTTLTPAHIAEDNIKLEALQKAASTGSTDPENEDGGWMPGNVKGLQGDEKGFVQLLEMEGDIVIPRATTSAILLPNAIVTVAVGSEGQDGQAKSGVVRYRHGKRRYTSYVLFPYHYEGANEIYPVSPLMKGRPIQIMVADSINRTLDAAMLKNSPPVGYDRSDQLFAQEGGPQIHPYAQWGTTDEVNVYSEIGGDPQALAGMMSLAINLYGELTGVLPARLGAQTLSHTTAFSKEAELQRGASRTVHYVNRVGTGALTRWLDMSYDMGRDSITSPMSLYIEEYGGFVEISKSDLPEKSSFKWFGSGGPSEEVAQAQRRLNSLQLAVQMDQLNIDRGGQPTVDIPAAIEQVLREGNWSDLDAILRIGDVPAGNQATPAVPGAAQGNGGTAIAALQALQGQGG